MQSHVLKKASPKESQLTLKAGPGGDLYCSGPRTQESCPHAGATSYAQDLLPAAQPDGQAL